MTFKPSCFFSSIPFRPFFINKHRLSFARLLENCLLDYMNISGRVLDIGGGSLASYRSLLNSSVIYESINIDSSLLPSYCINSDDLSYPVSSNSYDCCLLFNVLEHIFDWHTILSESRRALVVGGQLHILVPFLYPIHGCPDDFLRPTPSFLKSVLLKYGFSSVSTYPIALGPFTSAYSFCIPLPFIDFILRRLFVFLDFLFLRFFPSKHSSYIKRFPLIIYCIAS